MNEYGDDFVVLTDEDGKEYELEILATVEYNGATYKALIPAGSATAMMTSRWKSPFSRSRKKTAKNSWSPWMTRTRKRPFTNCS